MGGIKTFGAETLTAADVNTYLMRQTIMRFPTTAARDAIPTPEPGMLSYVAATGYTSMFDGAAWLPVLQRKAPTTITFLSGYKEFDPVGVPVRVSSLHGVGRLSGLLAPTSGTFPAGVNVNVATLPVGFRPVRAVFIAAMVPQGAGGAGIRIDPDGTVNVRMGTVAAAFVGLDGVTFDLLN